MKINSNNHVYETLPNFRNNRQLPEEEQIIIELKPASKPDIDKLNVKISGIRATDHEIYPPEWKAEKIEDASREFVASKFVSIRGLEVEGVGEIKDFETFHKEAPPELVAWVAQAVMSAAELMAADRSNFTSDGSETVVEE